MAHGIELQNCDKQIFKNGKCVAIMVNSTPEIIEAIVKEASIRSGAQMDWHYVGGRAVVLALGDLETAQSALGEMIPSVQFREIV